MVVVRKPKLSMSGSRPPFPLFCVLALVVERDQLREIRRGRVFETNEGRIVLNEIQVSN